ncbi:GntR family transcriptional regulator [Marinomonas communis]|uniref:DNA-binding GntR family transcriptional regulator n=1 Tax=Marinomonas communis TaxID=28254 RepID=A0A4R6XGE4_9GAMM|nr:GntR family transcriptional regulator [Marinomonas communis]TDR14868.1 DNA-binding GntR family transcriptional regulator [Marinomonas communis]
MKHNHLQQKILRELLQWIRVERLEAGHKLVTSQIAKQFGVSRTPVLAALDVLVKDDVVHYDKNKGYLLACHYDALDEQLETLPESGLEKLYQSICDNHFADPLGELSESEMMRRFDTSRALLLKCLSKILQEGWVVRNEGHGWQFIEVVNDETAYRESYEFRLLNEPAALLAESFQPDPNELASLIEEQQFIQNHGFEKLSAKELYDANIRFHETIISWANNRFTLQAIQRLNQLRRLVEYRQIETAMSRNIQSNEHLDILYAIQANEMSLASTLLKQHIERARSTKAPSR